MKIYQIKSIDRLARFLLLDKIKIKTSIFLLTCISSLLAGCQLIKDINKGQSPSPAKSESDSQICTQITWEEIKLLLTSDLSTITSDNNSKSDQYVSDCLTKLDKVDELIKIYNSTKDNKNHIKILNALNRNNTLIQNSYKVSDLYKSVATSENPALAPLALRGLTNSASDERWTNWQWSGEVNRILKEAVEKYLYKLALLDSTELLALANKYPDSLFTKACKEYRSFTEGVYFGQSGGSGGVFRQPFNPLREIEFWPSFLKKYPGHPGSDDAMYRLGRAYEIQGDYENAVIWYYKSSQAPDGNITTTRERTLFIIDLLMSSDSLGKFLKNHPTHPLFPYIVYSRAIHLIREDNFLIAQSELENFQKHYKDFKFDAFRNMYTSTDQYSLSPDISQEFWNDVEQQIKRVKELVEISHTNLSDSRLYEEGAFWFHNDYIAYNHFWRGGFNSAFNRFVPKKWEGVTTFTKESITYTLVQNSSKDYELQNRHLRSIRLFEKLLKDYPKSELAAKAKYSIALNYYYLDASFYPTLVDQKDSWKALAIKSFYELVKDFPSSSLADDALLTIAKTVEDKAVAVQALEKLVKDYPNEDRYQEAETILNNLRSQVPNQTLSSPPAVGVGITIEKLQTRNGVLIQKTLPNSPASRSGLQSGDIILQVDAQSVTSPDDVINIVRRHRPGETVRFKIERQGQKLVIEMATELR